MSKFFQTDLITISVPLLVMLTSEHLSKAKKVSY